MKSLLNAVLMVGCYLICTHCLLREAQAESDQLALLVGCTRYPNLAPSFSLEGPANDVVLMRHLLIERFGFRADSIVTLAAEVPGAQGLPTRSEIESQLKKLAERARAGDQVVVFLAGHGSQQPVCVEDRDYPEPDGLDEIFLPQDVGTWDGERGHVENAIVDDQLREWLEPIQKQGAFLWVIVDACHAGSMVRGSGVERVRQVPPEMLVPRAVLEAAIRRAAAVAPPTRGAQFETRPSLLSPVAKHWVAIYACQSTEPTVERPLPEDADAPVSHGLLTFTLNQVLMRSDAALTYRELVSAVERQYVAWGRTFPAPLVEGTDRDRQVLGKALGPVRSAIMLGGLPGGARVINAGALHGITSDSVLAVYPASGELETGRLLGHVRVKKTEMLSAVVEPCAYGGRGLQHDLPEGARCEIAFLDFRNRRLRLALDLPPPHEQGEFKLRYEALGSALQRLSEQPGQLLEYVAELRQSDWLVRVRGDQLWLMPSTGWTAHSSPDGRDATPMVSNALGPRTLDAETAPWLSQTLGRVARTRALLALADPKTAVATPRARQLDVQLEMRKVGNTTQMADEEGWQRDPDRMMAGDVVEFRVRNRSAVTVDVTLLFLDSGYGITAYFPRSGEVDDNRVRPGAEIRTPLARITSQTTGREHMLLIAVKAGGAPVDFGCLMQPMLDKVRSSETGVGLSFDSPLGQILKSTYYGVSSTRGATAVGLESYTVTCLTWTTAVER